MLLRKTKTTVRRGQPSICGQAARFVGGVSDWLTCATSSAEVGAGAFRRRWRSWPIRAAPTTSTMAPPAKAATKSATAIGICPDAEKNSIRTERVFCARKSTKAIPRMTPTINVPQAQLVRVGLWALRPFPLAGEGEGEACPDDSSIYGTYPVAGSRTGIPGRNPSTGNLNSHKGTPNCWLIPLPASADDFQGAAGGCRSPAQRPFSNRLNLPRILRAPSRSRVRPLVSCGGCFSTLPG